MHETGPRAFSVARDEDRFREHHGLGIGVLSFKVSTEDSQGRLLVVELVHHDKGGPGRHSHAEQDEWFYVSEGEYVFEVGQERHRLRAGDSLFVPRNMPHVWAHVSDSGRIVIAFTPAGPLEAFFRELSQANDMAPPNPALFRKYGMELLGPPLGEAAER
jgi:quercetin dioxygenase-like cupin family protein